MRSQLRYFLISLGLLTATTSISLAVFQHLELQADIDGLRAEQSLAADVAERALQRHLAISMRDIRFLASHPLLRQLMDTREAESYERFAQAMSNLAQVSAIYDQLRWIDLDGQERLRINYQPALRQAIVVPAQELQYKGDRPYFRASVELARGKVYVSALDLNVENGVVEFPYKPMLRFAMPVVDSFGNSQGIVVLNYLASIMLSDFASLASNVPRNVFLLNDDGYWLRGPSRSEEWGFMFDKTPVFAEAESELWSHIQHEHEGEWRNARGLWVWRTVDPSALLRLDEALFERGELINESHQQWIVLIQTPAHQLQELQQQINSRVFRVAGPLFVALLCLSWYLAGVLSSRAKAWRDLENLASHDGLTGLMNHRRFMEQLKSHWESWRRRPDIPMSLVMLDLDHFKAVNDTYGHPAGDDVLARFAQIVRAELRQTDFAGRIGGEEFCVLLFNCDSHGVVLFAERVRQQVENEVFVHESSQIRITVSLGASLFRASDSKPNDALERADQALYKAKQSGRNRLELDAGDSA